MFRVGAVAPVLWIPTQLEGNVIGHEVHLTCRIEAYPVPIVYWATETGELVLAGEFLFFLLLLFCFRSDRLRRIGGGADWRHLMTTAMESDYQMSMTLNIRNISAQDFRGYRCIVRNSLGETDGLIRLYGTRSTTEAH